MWNWLSGIVNAIFAAMIRKLADIILYALSIALLAVFAWVASQLAWVASEGWPASVLVGVIVASFLILSIGVGSIALRPYLRKKFGGAKDADFNKLSGQVRSLEESLRAYERSSGHLVDTFHERLENIHGILEPVAKRVSSIEWVLFPPQGPLSAKLAGGEAVRPSALDGIRESLEEVNSSLEKLKQKDAKIVRSLKAQADLIELDQAIEQFDRTAGFLTKPDPGTPMTNERWESLVGQWERASETIARIAKFWLPEREAFNDPSHHALRETPDLPEGFRGLSHGAHIEFSRIHAVLRGFESLRRNLDVRLRDEAFSLLNWPD